MSTSRTAALAARSPQPACGVRMLKVLPGLRRAAQRALLPARARSAATDSGGNWYSRDEAIMGTAIRVELWSADRGAAEQAMDAVMAQMHDVDRLMSPHKPDSELSRVNRDAARAPVAVGAEFFGLLERALDFSQRTDGAFDVTFASAGHLYDYRERIRPAPGDLACARAAIGYRNLLLDPARRTVRFARPGMRIDLGGFAKGHAVDRSVAILRGRGVRHAIVAAGGDSHVLGDRRGRPWTIGVRRSAPPGRVGRGTAACRRGDLDLR